MPCQHRQGNIPPTTSKFQGQCCKSDILHYPLCLPTLIHNLWWHQSMCKYYILLKILFLLWDAWGMQRNQGQMLILLTVGSCSKRYPSQISFWSLHNYFYSWIIHCRDKKNLRCHQTHHHKYDFYNNYYKS